MDGPCSTEKSPRHEMLEAREARWNHRQHLAQEYGLPVLSFTLRMPFALRGQEHMLSMAQALFAELVKRFEAVQPSSVRYSLFQTNADGPEGFIVPCMTGHALKNLALFVEHNHPLGTLADIDVLLPDGTPFGRADLGLPPRPCLVCGHEARLCLAEQRHTPDEVAQSIASLMAMQPALLRDGGRGNTLGGAQEKNTLDDPGVSGA